MKDFFRLDCKILSAERKADITNFDVSANATKSNNDKVKYITSSIGVSIVTTDKLQQEVPCNFHSATLSSEPQVDNYDSTKRANPQKISQSYPQVWGLAGNGRGIFRPSLRVSRHVQMIAGRYWATG